MRARKAGAEPFVPAGSDLPALRAAVQDCRGCELYREATQAVFSTGQVTAPLVLVGEVPGDEEDKVGLPFVGPAGRLLSRALREVDIDPEHTYVTNVVSISSSLSGASAASTRSRACSRSTPAGRGCAPSSRCCARGWWWPSAPPRRRRWRGHRFG